ncbi:MAG: hypothetical protein LH609_04480 [Rudanella sp.]|nr:hypothetical protein [Rudanella sp.]
MKTAGIVSILVAGVALSLMSAPVTLAQYGQPGYGRPDYNQVGYNQQDYGQPGYDEPYDGDFYDDLSPYGQWVQTPKYGRVWIPDAGPDFQPYASGGHWVVTEYGNTWVSDYDWGWATFHYGRWYQDRYRGWAWIPGRDWGPAWVSWRSGGGYYGWAPLGPGININVNVNIPSAWWTFVPQIYITSPRLYSYCVPRQRVVNIYQNTTIINNVYRVNNRSYAYGPRRDEIERVTRRSVPVYRVENSGRPGRDEIRNNSVGIHRPEMSRNARGNSYGDRSTYSRPDNSRTNPGTYEGGPRNNQNRNPQQYQQPQSNPTEWGNSANGNGRRNRYDPSTQSNQPSYQQPQNQPSYPQQPTSRPETVPQPDRGNRRGGGGYSQRDDGQQGPGYSQPANSQPGGGQTREQRSGSFERRAQEAERNMGQPPAQTQSPERGNGGGGRGGSRGPR